MVRIGHLAGCDGQEGMKIVRPGLRTLCSQELQAEDGMIHVRHRLAKARQGRPQGKGEQTKRKSGLGKNGKKAPPCIHGAAYI
jgi:hypothetical protein